MSAAEAIWRARAAGLEIDVVGNELVLRAEVEPPPEIVNALKDHKHQVIASLRIQRGSPTEQDWRDLYEERAAILEFDQGLPRSEAERIAFDCCIAEWLITQLPPVETASSCLVCGNGDQPSNPLLPFGAAPHPPTWLHGPCWETRQAARREEARMLLAGLLAGMKES